MTASIGSRDSGATRRAGGDSVDETQARPRVVERGDLVVDEPTAEPDRLHQPEHEIGRDARRLLRPRDPQPAVVLERAQVCGKARCQLRVSWWAEDQHMEAA